MTEADAKSKWCPLARAPMQILHSDPMPANRLDHGGMAPQARCIGSTCMAWHFDTGQHNGEPVGHCGAFGKE
jgi:hypothetical protein